MSLSGFSRFFKRSKCFIHCRRCAGASVVVDFSPKKFSFIRRSGQVFFSLSLSFLSLSLFFSLSPKSGPADGGARRRHLRRRRRNRGLLRLDIDVPICVGSSPRGGNRDTEHLKGSPRHRPRVVRLDHRNNRRVAVGACLCFVFFEGYREREREVRVGLFFETKEKAARK